MIPSEINIDGLHWTVDVSDQLSRDNWGETRTDECRMLIFSGLQERVREMTFWHEVVHTIFKTRDFKLHPNTEDLEEQVARFLGPALCSFMWANAEIVWHNG